MLSPSWCTQSINELLFSFTHYKVAPDAKNQTLTTKYKDNKHLLAKLLTGVGFTNIKTTEFQSVDLPDSRVLKVLNNAKKFNQH